MRTDRLTRWGLALGVASLFTGTSAVAQERTGGFRVGASAGAFAPRSSVIRTEDGSDTRFSAGPAAVLDLEYQAVRRIAIYGSAAAAFPSLTLGSSIRPEVLGPSEQVLLLQGTGGVLLSVRVGERFQPTLRVGGGLKYYKLNLTGAESHARLTGDFGVGFRGLGSGPLEAGFEIRYQPSAFDQSKLPTRAIVPQNQRQNDWLLAVGFGFRL